VFLNFCRLLILLDRYVFIKKVCDSNARILFLKRIWNEATRIRFSYLSLGNHCDRVRLFRSHFLRSYRRLSTVFIDNFFPLLGLSFLAGAYSYSFRVVRLILYWLQYKHHTDCSSLQTAETCQLDNTYFVPTVYGPAGGPLRRLLRPYPTIVNSTVVSYYCYYFIISPNRYLYCVCVCELLALFLRLLSFVV